MSTSTPPGGEPEYPQRNAKADAKAAKAYYKASRPWYKKKRFIIPLALVVLIAISTAFSGGGGSDSGDTTASDTSNEASSPKATKKQAAPTKKAAPKPPPGMKVKAAAILQDFDENEAAADAKYNGKTLRVAGVVEKVDTDMFNDDEYIVRLAGGGDFVVLTVNCNGIPASVAAKINKGDKATVVGKFDDGGDLGVELKDCAVA